MTQNPYEPPQTPALHKPRYIVGPSSNYALLAFPVAWLVLPVLWLVNAVQHGTFMGVAAELTLVLVVSALYGTLAGGILCAILVVILRLIRGWNERLQPPE